MRRFDRRSCRGFTLLEILLVVMVIGICAAAFIPVAMNTVDSSRIRSGLRQTVALNRYARTQAILSRQSVGVSYHPAENEVRLNLQEALVEDGESPEAPLSLRAYGKAPVEAGTLGWHVRRRVLLPNGLDIGETSGMQMEGDTYFVIYLADGTTDSHMVNLVDRGGETYQLRVEGISGNVDLHSKY